MKYPGISKDYFKTILHDLNKFHFKQYYILFYTTQAVSKSVFFLALINNCSQRQNTKLSNNLNYSFSFVYFDWDFEELLLNNITPLE